MSKVAIVQKAPVFLNKNKTIAKAVSLISECASAGAELVVFTETFIPGYPAWIWRLRPGGDWDTSEKAHSLLFNNAVNLDTSDLVPLYTAAKDTHTTIVFGINEVDSEFSKSTLYNTVVVIGTDGTILNRHRKLMPTNPERMVWGFGDATGLKVMESPSGRLGTLICWENYMPLARYSLYAQGVEIYIAPTYDSGEKWIETLCHIAREGCCWVIGSGNILHSRNIPDDFPEKSKLYPNNEEWINQGDSVVIAPGGKVVAGPLRNEEGILYHDIDLSLVSTAKRTMDVAGHYSRPDIFKLNINTQPQPPVELE